MSAVRVLLVDDNEAFVSGASEWLVAGAGVELVGTAATGSQAIAQNERLAPDVVLVDESVPDMKVHEVVARLKASAAAPRVFLLTFHEGETARQAAAGTGADGVVVRSRFTDLVFEGAMIHAKPRD